MRRLVLLAVLAGCPRAPTIPKPEGDPRPAAACEKCSRAQNMLGLVTAFSDVKHDFILDPASSFVPGRGVERTGSGLWSPVPTACARVHGQQAAEKIDAQTIDVGFIGVAVDSTLVGADADLTPYFSAGGSASVRKVRLVAIAFVRDLDPQFFDASENVSFAEAACACARATHFVGSVKLGGMLAYETEVRAGEVHGKALDVLKARFEKGDASITETRVGGLEVEGLETALKGGTAALTFKVKNPVPIAYSVYPLADICKFAFPAPEVTPTPVDFGDVPYGVESARYLHVVNRAPIDLSVSFRGKLYEVGAHATVDLLSRWVPSGDAVGCEAQVREDTILFSPRDARVPVVPRQHSVKIVEHVRSGRATVLRRETIDTGEHRSPDYKKTEREIGCPPDYVLSGCRAENAHCAGGSCNGGGYAIASVPSGNGCRFGCTGPTSLLIGSHSCRFDAVTECKLKCTR